MLLELLRRDWILHRQAMIPILAIFSAFQVWFLMSVERPRHWLVFTCIYVAFFTIVPFTRDDKFRANEWSCTLPVSRKDLVRARYVAAWLLFVGCLLLGLLLAALVPGSKVEPLSLMAPGEALWVLTVASVILLLLLPFTIRFGLLGVVIFLAALQILGAVLLVVGKSVGNQSEMEGGVRAGIRVIVSGVSALRETMPPAAFHAVWLLVLALVNWVGYRVALALFRRREL
jgi:hypothetical protein